MTVIIAVVAGVSQCEFSVGEEPTDIQTVWTYYDDPSIADNLSVTLGRQEAIIGYGSDYFKYTHTGYERSYQADDFSYLKGLFAERPESSVCAPDQTCLCHCGNVVTQELNGTEKSNYFGDTGRPGTASRPAGETPKNISSGQIMCENAKCRSHPAPLKRSIDAETVFGQGYRGFGAQRFEESFIILNAPGLVKPTQTVGQTPYTFAGYTDEQGTKTQTLSITKQGDARTICLHRSCR